MNDTTWNAHRLATYRISRAWELGSVRMNRILQSPVGPIAFLRHTSLWEAEKFTPIQRHALERECAFDDETLIRSVSEESIRMILSTDDEFPNQLKQIPNPPAVLFCKGAPITKGMHVAIVGTRKMTTYGRTCATFFARALSEHGIPIISGLAFGIDITTLHTAVQHSGRPIAILPNGVDHTSITPRAHIEFAKRIIEQQGTLLSEHPPGTPNQPFHYLLRNRLISGLADLTIVIEADRDSGSLVTARAALEQGKDVLAVPGSIWSPYSRGTNDLIRDGATPLLTMDDIWRTLEIRETSDIFLTEQARSTLPVSEEEALVLRALHEPMSIDTITRSTKLTASVVGAVLSVLEMKGHVNAVGPKTYARSHLHLT